MGSDPRARLSILQPAGDGTGIPRQREGVPERDRGARPLFRRADRSRTRRSFLRPRGAERRRPRRAVDATDEYVFVSSGWWLVAGGWLGSDRLPTTNHQPPTTTMNIGITVFPTYGGSGIV